MAICRDLGPLSGLGQGGTGLVGEGAGRIGPGSVRGSGRGDCATRLSGRAGGEGLGARSWGVWLLVGLAGLCEAQLCPEL